MDGRSGSRHGKIYYSPWNVKFDESVRTLIAECLMIILMDFPIIRENLQSLLTETISLKSDLTLWFNSMPDPNAEKLRQRFFVVRSHILKPETSGFRHRGRHLFSSAIFFWLYVICVDFQKCYSCCYRRSGKITERKTQPEIKQQTDAESTNSTWFSHWTERNTLNEWIYISTENFFFVFYSPSITIMTMKWKQHQNVGCEVRRTQSIVENNLSYAISNEPCREENQIFNQSQMAK